MNTFSLTSTIHRIYLNEKTQFFISVLIANAIIIVGAKLYIPFHPVPITLQTFAICFVGLYFPRKIAVLSTIAYLLEGALGLPIFSSPETGMKVLFGYTSGYLFSFVLMAYICSSQWLDRFIKVKFIRVFVLQTLANLVMFTCGVAILSYYFGGIMSAIYYGFLPFIVNDLIKIFSLSFLTSFVKDQK